MSNCKCAHANTVYKELYQLGHEDESCTAIVSFNWFKTFSSMKLNMQS